MPRVSCSRGAASHRTGSLYLYGVQASASIRALGSSKLSKHGLASQVAMLGQALSGLFW